MAFRKNYVGGSKSGITKNKGENIYNQKMVIPIIIYTRSLYLK